MIEPNRILFFDGHCLLCSRSVDFLIANDKNRMLSYAPLQGKYAANLLTAEDRSLVSGVIYLRDGKRYDKSDAIILVLSDIGWKRWLVRLMAFVPRFLRNRVYDLIASSRYKLFGKSEQCKIPTPDEKMLFLD